MEETKILVGIDLSIASKELIEVLIEDTTDPSIFEEIARTNVKRPDILTLLLEHPETPENVRDEISKSLHAPVKTHMEVAKVKRPPEDRTQTILQKVQKLSVSEKLQLALKGGKEIRSLLLRDPNKEIALSVLDNPKLTETEVEVIAKSRSISDEALRKITKKREWMKNYNIILSLVTNPKTPPGIAMSLISELKTKDLAILEKNKNVVEGIRVTAKKLLKARKAH
ncbi:MAG: hypothetical protein AB1610_10045 [Nitrospirota bacterium]